MLMNMDETRLNTIPAQEMSIDERLDEIAIILKCAIIRIEKRDKESTYFSGLHSKLKRSCDKGDRRYETTTT